MTQRLVYTGSVAVSVMGLDRELNPGAEFSVPDEQAESFLRRSDMSSATDHNMAESEDSKPAPKPKKAAQSEPAA